MTSSESHPYLRMATNWNVAPLKDLTTKIGSGATPRGGKNSYVDQGVHLIRSQNVHDLHFSADGLAHITDDAADKLAGVEVEQGDVLLNITGASIARCCQAPDWVLPARVNQHVAIVRPSEALDRRFLMYLLVHPDMRAYVLSHNAGASREAITKRHIEGLLVPVPPRDEQRAIAEVLGALDDRIEWIARCDGIIHELARTTAELHEGVETVPLAEIAAIHREMISADDLDGEVWAHYSIPAFDGGNGPVVESGEDIRSGKYRVPSSSVLVSKLNPTWHRVWLPTQHQDLTAICSTEFMPLVPKDEELRAPLWAALLSRNLNRQMRERVTGSTGSHQRVRPDDLMACRVADVRAFKAVTHQAVRGLAERLVQLRSERYRLIALRDALLPQLLSGNLRIEEPARLLGAVA